MRIDSNGNLGIGGNQFALFNAVGGTTKLAVVGESSSTAVIGNTDASISIINKDGTALNTAGLHFARADTDETPNYAGASIVAQFSATQVTGQYPAADLNFCTSTAQNSAPSLKLTLAADGDLIMPNVSSSTQTAFRPPFIDFQIAADNPAGVNKGIYWHSVTASTNVRTYGAIFREQSTGHLFIDSQTDQVFTCNGAANERMRIKSNGYVGIGTSAPAHALDVTNGEFRMSDGRNMQWGGANCRIVGTNNGIFEIYTGGASRMTIANAGTVNVVGTFTAGTKTFKIDHPLPSKTDTHYLLHSSIEGPQADLIYRGRTDLVSGVATVNIDTVSGMTEGTFELLCGDVQCFTSNEDGWTALKGSVTGNVLTVTAQEDTCTDTISWMVIGERKDAKMIESEWADDDGKLIVETLKGDHDFT
jgi:hypothetical protein